MLSYIFQGTYGAATALPAVLAGKCSGTTCTTLNTDVTSIKSCFTDPTAAACTGSYNHILI